MTEQLLSYFRRHANRYGLVLGGEAELCRDLRASPSEINAGLQALASSGVVRVLSPLPFLVAKFISWSSSSHDVLQKEQQNSNIPAVSHNEVPVSSSAAAAAMQQREEGGAGEGKALLDEVLQILGAEADRSEFREILGRHQPSLIRRCLKRVQVTRNIRVSRAALFRSLLDKLSR